MLRSHWLRRCVTLGVLLGLLWLGAGTAAAAGEPAQTTTSVVRRFAGLSVVAGSAATLISNDSGAYVTLKTSELTPGDTVTIWFVIFNNPTLCSNPVPDPAGGPDLSACGSGDLLPLGGDPSIESSVVHLAGRVIGGSGKGNFGGAVAVGDTSDALFGPGLLNPRTAEIHLIVRSHGPLIPGLVDDQIHTVDGGCNINVCTDPQFSVLQQ